MTYQILQGDALQVLKGMESESVQCVITQQPPTPYFQVAYYISGFAARRALLAFGRSPLSAFAGLRRQEVGAYLGCNRIAPVRWQESIQPVAVSKLDTEGIALIPRPRLIWGCGNASAEIVFRPVEGI